MNGPSWRKPMGVLIILALIAIWAIVVASFSPLISALAWPFQTAIYIVTGIIWIMPLKPLLRWTETGRWRG